MQTDISVKCWNGKSRSEREIKRDRVPQTERERERERDSHTRRLEIPFDLRFQYILLLSIILKES